MKNLDAQSPNTFKKVFYSFRFPIYILLTLLGIIITELRTHTIYHSTNLHKNRKNETKKGVK